MRNNGKHKHDGCAGSTDAHTHTHALGSADARARTHTHTHTHTPRASGRAAGLRRAELAVCEACFACPGCVRTHGEQACLAKCTHAHARASAV